MVPELDAPMRRNIRVPLLIPIRPNSQTRRAALACRPFVLTVLMAIVLLWPAYINGGPFWFPDTSNYIRSADAATVVVTGSPSEWSDRLKLGDDAPGEKLTSEALISHGRAGLYPTRPVLSGRSIYYGFLIYIPMRYFGPWGAAFLQALLTASILLYCTSVTRRGRDVPDPRWALGAFAVLLLLTPLPFYASMLMPDVYSGLVILTLTTLIVFWDELRNIERAGLIAISGAITSFHNTNLLLTLSLGTFGAVIYAGRRRVWRPVLVATTVLSLGILAGLVFTMAVEHSLHKKPISPPFLSARTTAAGPGTSFLERECARDNNAWALCSDLQKLPVASDSFLWSENPKVGVFQLASPDRQRRLSDEDTRFFLALVRNDPWGIVCSSLSSTLKELTSFDLVNFNYPTKNLGELVSKYPPSIARSIASSRASQGSMPTGFVVFASVAISLVSLGLLGLVFLRAAQGRYLSRVDYGVFVLLLLLGVFCNAAICGSLSGPHARYQMRLIWLLPYAAIMIIGATNRLTRRGPKVTKDFGAGR